MELPQQLQLIKIQFKMAETNLNKVVFIKKTAAQYGALENVVAGGIYFVLGDGVGKIYVDNKCYGEANLSGATVANVTLEDSGEHAGSIKITYTTGDPTYIPLPEGKIYSAGNGIEISDADVISADVDYISDNVKIGSDLTVTNATGALKAGYKVSADTSLKSLLKKMLQEVKQPGTPTAPSLTVSLTNAGAKEVGTKVTPAYTTKFNAGSYTYGPATGVTAISYSISNGSETKDTATGSFDEITVADGMSYKLTATAAYSDGVVANDNTGATSNPEIKISAGTTATASSSAITGFRSFFYGTKVSGLATYTSADVRALSNGNAAATAGKTFKITIPSGTKQVVIAVPAARSLKSVINVGLSRGEVADTFVSTTVDVEGANGYTAASYKVYVFNSSTALDDNTYEVTLA